MNVGSLFSGIGLLDYGLTLAGLEHSWLCESDPWRREILELRWLGVPVFDDIRAVGAASARPVDVIVGGFPCRGISGAGKGEGFGHPETVLWREMFRTIRELRPRYVLIENVARILTLDRGSVIAEVFGDLAALGFDVVWDCLPAAAVGAPHRRDRFFAVASHPDRTGRLQCGGTEPRASQLAATERTGPPAPDTCRRGRSGEGRRGPLEPDQRAVGVQWGEYGPAIERWERIHGPAPEPLVCRVDDGRPSGLERSRRAVERRRLSGLGDGVQVQVGRLCGEYILHHEREQVRT